MSLGSPLVSPAAAGCHVPVDRRHRTCGSVPLFNREALEAYGVLRECRPERIEAARL